MCQRGLPLCSGPACWNFSLLSLQLHNASVQFLRRLFVFASGLFSSLWTQAEGPGPGPGCCSRCSVHLCGCCVQDSFVGPGMHSLAVKSTAWLWLIVLCWVSIQPVCHILIKKRRKKKPPCSDQIAQTNKRLWHAAAACSSQTGQAMTSHETWLSQVFISHGCCSQSHHDERILTADASGHIETSFKQD